MSFSENFISGYMLTPVGPRQRTFAQWSLENTIHSGLQGNQSQVQALREGLTSAFHAGISQLEQSQIRSAKLLQREIQHQTENIVDAIDRGSSDVVDALQKACDYLGGQLCEVRWAIERQSEISKQILQLLLNALDNTSRQYWEQGVRCYDTSEYELARERFNRALDANRTNYFAYQYLGFIAVHEEKSVEAIQNFDLARKFADTAYHRALALSHLARSHNAIGDLSNALQSAVSATQAAPENARFWYECATYYVRASNADAAIKCLRRSINEDWMYWSISLSDASFDPIREEVVLLLEQMREEQRVIAREALDSLGKNLSMIHEMGITAEVAKWKKLLDQSEVSYRERTVFAYRNLVSPVRDSQNEVLLAAIATLDQRMTAKRAALSSARQSQQDAIERAQARITEVERKADRTEDAGSSDKSGQPGCLLSAIGIVVLCSLVLILSARVPAVILAFIIAFACCLWPVVAHYRRVVAPVRNLRSQIPELKKDLEKVKRESAAALALEHAKLNSELQLLQDNREKCQLAFAQKRH